jgi:hypothetical protein
MATSRWLALSSPNACASINPIYRFPSARDPRRRQSARKSLPSLAFGDGSTAADVDKGSTESAVIAVIAFSPPKTMQEWTLPHTAPGTITPYPSHPDCVAVSVACTMLRPYQCCFTQLGFGACTRPRARHSLPAVLCCTRYAPGGGGPRHGRPLGLNDCRGWWRCPGVFQDFCRKTNQRRGVEMQGGEAECCGQSPTVALLTGLVFSWSLFLVRMIC